MGINGKHYEKTCAKHFVKLSKLQKALLVAMCRPSGNRYFSREFLKEIFLPYEFSNVSLSNISRALSGLIRRGLVHRAAVNFYTPAKAVKQMVVYDYDAAKGWVWVGIKTESCDSVSRVIKPESRDSVSRGEND
jgi:hypothetical protein